MMDCYITFRSITPAQRGRSLLRRENIDCSIGRTPRFMAEQGCGYSVRLKAADVSRGVMLLKENSIAYRKVYRKDYQGSYEEMTL